MKHPSSEDWMTLLYGEATPERKSQLTAHLAQCPACSAQVAQWRQSMTALDAWPDAHLTGANRGRPWMKWAAAAALIVGLGFGAGRISTLGHRDAAEMEASLRAEFKRGLAEARATMLAEFQGREAALLASAQNASITEAQRLLAEFNRATEGRRATDLQTVFSAMQRLDTQRREDHAALRKELETVAVTTEDSLVHLAGTRLPELPNP